MYSVLCHTEWCYGGIVCMFLPAGYGVFRLHLCYVHHTSKPLFLMLLCSMVLFHMVFLSWCLVCTLHLLHYHDCGHAPEPEHASACCPMVSCTEAAAAQLACPSLPPVVCLSMFMHVINYRRVLLELDAKQG